MYSGKKKNFNTKNITKSLKFFFFPDVLGQRADGDKASYVARELVSR